LTNQNDRYNINSTKMQFPQTDFSQIGYGHLDNRYVPLSVSTVGMIMKQIHETSVRASQFYPSDTTDKMKKFSKDISAQYVQMVRGKLSIFDKIVRGTLLNGSFNTGYLKKPIGKNYTHIHKIRFGHLMSHMLSRIDYILENFDPDHEAFPFKSPKLREPFDTFKDELIEFADFLEEKCQEWKALFQKDSSREDATQEDSTEEDEIAEVAEVTDPTKTAEIAEPTKPDIVLVTEGVVIVS